jgi:hypothetical protein
MSSKDFGSSVDSTLTPSRSVKSIGSTGTDSLSVVMDKFVESPYVCRIRRNVFNIVRKSLQDDGTVQFRREPQTYGSKRETGALVQFSLLSACMGQRSRTGSGIPTANLLRPPRGNLSCSMKDLNRECLALRRMGATERASAAARLVRTLDPSLPTHTDLAFSLFLIANI